MGDCDGYVSEASCAERRAATHKVCSERHQHEFIAKDDHKEDMDRVEGGINNLAMLKADKDTIAESTKATTEGIKGVKLLVYVIFAAIAGQYILAIFKG
ncbi:hypothetical protein KAR91_20460 [Candidatus Pacearchaeota archaeon]|nr:hypothetical protein [Candidatus Pacearchaeota archaeon]